jgi:hypothetical protein
MGRKNYFKAKAFISVTKGKMASKVCPVSLLDLLKNAESTLSLRDLMWTLVIRQIQVNPGSLSREEERIVLTEEINRRPLFLPLADFDG